VPAGNLTVVSPLTAAAWAVAGAFAVESVELVGEFDRNRTRWPWRGKRLWPSVVALLLKLGTAAVLAAAMSDQFAGRWPAFVAGVAAPLIITRVAQGTAPADEVVPK
jgi:hypothetical protein